MSFAVKRTRSRTSAKALCIRLGWVIGLAILAAGTSAWATVELRLTAQGLDRPVYVAHAGDGSNRLFIVEQGGRIRVLRPGGPAPTTFLDIMSRVLSGGERGLLGLAFHPQFRDNGRLFVNYTRDPDGATVIAEYRVSAGDPDVADPSERVLLTVAQPFANHTGRLPLHRPR
jgi:glucose/arabinose dehydrogenase